MPVLFHWPIWPKSNFLHLWVEGRKIEYKCRQGKKQLKTILVIFFLCIGGKRRILLFTLRLKIQCVMTVLLKNYSFFFIFYFKIHLRKKSFLDQIMSKMEFFLVRHSSRVTSFPFSLMSVLKM